jgi:hypothetical protein
MRIKCSHLFRAECLAQHPRKYTMCAEKRTTRSQADLHTDLWGCAARGARGQPGERMARSRGTET